MRRAITPIALTLALLIGVSTTGCFGKFALTKKIYEWNDSLGNKFVKTLVLWGLIIIPVYEVCVAADYFVLNLIEFWTGSNLIADSGNARLRGMEPQLRDDGSVAISFEGHAWALRPIGEEGFELVREGEVIGRAMLRADGGLDLDTKRGGHIALRAPTPIETERVFALAAR